MQLHERLPADATNPDLIVRLTVQALLVMVLLASAVAANAFVILAATSAILINTFTVLFRLLAVGHARRV